MSHDPFLNGKSADPDAVVKSTPAPGIRKAAPGKPDKSGLTPAAGAGSQRPPGPRVIEVDGDQDSVARTMDSEDPTDSWRPGYVTDAAEEGEELYGARPEARRPRVSDQVPPTGDQVGRDDVVGKIFRPVGKSDQSDQSDTLRAAAARGWAADGGISAARGGGVVLSHADLPGHQIHVAGDGKWSHMGPGPDGSRKLHEAGVGAGGLRDHLRSLHTGLAKSGPRVV